MNQTERYRESREHNAPWTTFAKIEVAVLAVFSLVLLGVGINTVAQVLIASGIPGFERAWRCYLFSLTPIGIAFGLKCLRVFIREHRHQVMYTVCVWIVGLILGVFWAHLFAQQFPALTQSAADIVNSLTTAGVANAGRGIAFIVVSILAEAFLAAGCWLTIEAIMEKHQASRRVEDAAFQKSQTDLDRWLQRRDALRRLGAILEGKLHEIQEGEHRFVEKAVGCLHAAIYVSAAQDQQLKLLFK